MFLKSKPLDQKADEERNKVTFKKLQLEGQNVDRQMVIAKRRKAEELRRLTA